MKRIPRPLDEIRTTLGSETLFNGTMKFSESLKVNGRYEGRIESSGFLYIEVGAEVSASLKVKSVVIGGTVKGDIEADQEVEILETGKVYGNIRTARLKLADGVVFEGKIEMIRHPEAIDVFSATASQIKQSLDVY